jgi:endoglucanase
MPGGVPADVLGLMARGVNVAGWMDSPSSPAPKVETLKQLRELGLTHVRLPVPAELVMARFTDKTIIDGELGHIERALATLHALGFAVSVDLHPGDAFKELHRRDPASGLNAAKDAWRRLSQLFDKYDPNTVYAELLNEPEIEATLWQTQIAELAAYVRKLLPRTTLIVGPTNWQRADSLPQFEPLADLNVVYAIHFYDPMAFTHQGHWDERDPLHAVRGLGFPVESNAPETRLILKELSASSRPDVRELTAQIAEAAKIDPIQKGLEPAVQWQTRHKRPLLMNEFGVLKAAAPQESRSRWLQAVVTAAESHCWGWTHWELEQGFGLTDSSGRLEPSAMNALLGGRGGSHAPVAPQKR